MNNIISLGNHHIFVCGITRSGKTYFVKNAIKSIKYPVIFFNIQNEDMPQNYLRANEKMESAQIFDHLRHGGKIDFRFSNDCRLADCMKIIGFFIRKLMIAGYTQARPVYIVIDEAHLLKGEALNGAIDASTRGLMRGCRLITITQRPALVNKTIYTQAADQYLFRLATSEASYLKTKGVDYEKCKQLWSENGQYSYIYFDGMTLEGRKAIK